MASHAHDQQRQREELQRDGLVPALYKALWTKNEYDDGEGARVNLPDTVVFRHRTIEAWYFTSKADGGRVKRKKAGSVSLQAIEEHFLSRTAPDFDIVACYLETDPKHPETPPVIEYFDAAALRTSHGLQLLRELLCHLLSFVAGCHGVHTAPGQHGSPKLQQLDASLTLISVSYDTIAGDFLYRRMKPLEGVLQRFVQPQGAYNGTRRTVRELSAFA